jgi:hypothetical protein
MHGLESIEAEDDPENESEEENKAEDNEDDHGIAVEKEVNTVEQSDGDIESILCDQSLKCPCFNLQPCHPQFSSKMHRIRLPQR